MAKRSAIYDENGIRFYESGRFVRDAIIGMALMGQSICVISSLPFELDNPTRLLVMAITLAVSGLGLLRTGYVYLDHIAGGYGHPNYDRRGNITNSK